MKSTSLTYIYTGVYCNMTGAMTESNEPTEPALDPSNTPYSALTPDAILDCLENVGLQPSGRMLALNSYENRVYQIELDEGEYVVVKFYRAGRWSDDTILEEHAFALELAAHTIPVIPPQEYAGQTLLHFNQYRFAIYPRRGGRPPELDNLQHLEQLGRMLGRIHAVGRLRPFQHRLRLDVASYGRTSLAAIQHSGFLPDYLLHNYTQIVTSLLEQLDSLFTDYSPNSIRLHGDCHPGNILWTANGPHFVDLDDCCMGPAMQDLWMLLSGSRAEMSQQLRAVLDGYELFCDFDYAEIRLLEALRALRLIHYSAWLTRRWHDPAFPMHFPWFNTPRYWEEQIMILREQLDVVEGAALQV